LIVTCIFQGRFGDGGHERRMRICDGKRAKDEFANKASLEIWWMVVMRRLHKTTYKHSAPKIGPTNVLDRFNESCLMSPYCEMLNTLVM
jgi:hypothetical protein